MGFRTVIVNSRCKLEFRLNYLVIRGEREKRIFINEINTLIVQSTAVSLTAALLCELTRNNVKVIFCDEKNNPQTELVAYQTLLEKIICYINLYVELKNTKLFVFIGLKDILTDEDLDLLYHHCALQKVCLWLIESTKKRPSLPQEKVVIITEDLCEIVENIP